jgi:hypothetical protein
MCFEHAHYFACSLINNLQYKINFMLTVTPSIDTSPLREFGVWLVAIALVAFGFRYAKELIAFVLDKLYQHFILDNPTAI